MGLPISVPWQTVAEAMIRTPWTHSPEITVLEARRVFDDTHIHMLLLARGGVLHATLIRADLEPHLDPRRPAIDLGRLAGRTIGPGAQVDDALHLMTRSQTRRLAVTDNRLLLGLLCLKQTLHGFCSEADVVSRSEDRLS